MRRAVLMLLPALTACANMAGLDGKSEFACRAPDGVVCTSVSGVYANTVAGTLPAKQMGSVPHGAAPESATEIHPKGQADAPRPYGAAPPSSSTPAAGTPLLSPPRVLRLWFAPWVDEDGDLHDQSYLYVMWHRGEWQLGHTEADIRRQFGPITPIGAAPVTAPAGVRIPDPATQREASRQDARETVLDAARPSRQAEDDER
ncbi:MAG TPA: type IV conjugative transfer system lipoprotein TraV [Thiobacillaceae bacterium]|nr:type IV conjugative transfer system lipoprotein TraV [Thiobacillaceae bacterium]